MSNKIKLLFTMLITIYNYVEASVVLSCDRILGLRAILNNDELNIGSNYQMVWANTESSESKIHKFPFISVITSTDLPSIYKTIVYSSGSVITPKSCFTAITTSIIHTNLYTMGQVGDCSQFFQMDNRDYIEMGRLILVQVQSCQASGSVIIANGPELAVPINVGGVAAGFSMPIMVGAGLSIPVTFNENNTQLIAKPYVLGYSSDPLISNIVYDNGIIQFCAHAFGCSVTLPMVAVTHIDICVVHQSNSPQFPVKLVFSTAASTRIIMVGTKIYTHYETSDYCIFDIPSPGSGQLTGIALLNNQTLFPLFTIGIVRMKGAPGIDRRFMFG
jgi:hypothetical protein